MNRDQATIDLRLFASLADRTPSNASHYPIETGITVRQLLETIHLPPAEAKLIFINGVQSHLDSCLKGGERVGVFPQVGGG